MWITLTAVIVQTYKLHVTTTSHSRVLSLFKSDATVEFSKQFTYCKTTLNPNIAVPETDPITYAVLSKAQNTCLMGNYLVPQNVYRYRRDIVQTNVVITEFNYT